MAAADRLPRKLKAHRRLVTALARALLGAGRLAARPAFTAGGLAAPALVFAPHPDDEALGCGGTIALKAAAGAPITVVIMTDGRASHAGRIDAARLVALRREETLNAAQCLGLRAQDVVFLDFPDHELSAHAAEAQARVAALLAEHTPAQVYVPHRRDRLEDHVATFDIVQAALKRHAAVVRVFEYPVWLWNTWPWTAGKPLDGPGAGARLRARLRAAHDALSLAFGCRDVVDIRPAEARKRAAMAAYVTQFRRPEHDPGWPVLADVSGGEFVDCFLAQTEVFRCSGAGGPARPAAQGGA